MKPRQQGGKRRTRKWFGAAIVLVLVAGGLAAFGAYRLRRVQANAKLPLAPARKGDFLVIVRCRGDLKARRSAQITAPTNIPDLRIMWLAPENSEVSQGQAVIRFDSSGALRQLQQRQAALRQTEATRDQANAEARITEEQDKRDLANARYEVERAQLEASKKAIVSVIQGEESRIDLLLAERKLRVQEATVGLHEASSRSKIASVTRVRDQAKAEVELINRRLGQMEVKAPLSGIVVYMPNYSQGWINAKPFKVGDQVWPGATVAELPELSTIELDGRIEEIDRGRVSVGNDVRVRIDALPELAISAKLARISPLTQMTFEWPPTSSFRGYANLEKADPRLRPGMNGSMDIVVQRLQNAIAVPAKALFTRHGRPIVFVSANNKYAPREVKVVARNPDEVAVEGIPGNAKVTLVEPDTTGGGK